jgi:hypothetical protein
VHKHTSCLCGLPMAALARSGSRLHLGAAFFDLGRPFRREQVFQANAGIPSGGMLLIEDLTATPPFVTENRTPLAPPAFAKTRSDPISFTHHLWSPAAAKVGDQPQVAPGHSSRLGADHSVG